jgi:hypothetical protein
MFLAILVSPYYIIIIIVIIIAIICDLRQFVFLNDTL